MSMMDKEVLELRDALKKLKGSYSAGNAVVINDPCLAGCTGTCFGGCSLNCGDGCNVHCGHCCTGNCNDN